MMTEETDDNERNGPAAADGEDNGKRRRRRRLKWGAVAAAFVACAVGGYLYARHQSYYPSTDDAYVMANAVRIAPVVSGRVIAAPAANLSNVAQGALLLRIDPRPYQYRIDKAQAALQAAGKGVGARAAAVSEAEAAVRSKQAALRNARQTYRRVKDLAARGTVPRARLDDAQAALRSAKADLQLARAQVKEARGRLGEEGDKNAKVRQAVAQLEQARLDLDHTEIRATCDGQLNGFSVQPGDMLQPGQDVGVLVCDGRFWVYANFKETDLTRIRPGQTATLNMDMYPDRTFHGIVESLAPASGAAYSLLPPENATGNWVKVTQRVPVRILVVDTDPRFPLRVQTSAGVTVRTGEHDQPLGKPRTVTLSDAQAMQIAREKGLVPAGTAEARAQGQ